MSDLKKCPFCGEIGIRVEIRWIFGIFFGFKRHAIECFHCGARTKYYKGKFDCEYAWEMRKK
jgi:hypothetical protein